MRIKFFNKILCLFLLFFSQLTISQTLPFSMQLSITPANFNLVDVIVNKNLSGTPRIVELTMSERGRLIVLEGEIAWDEKRNGNFKSMYSFRTNPFKSRLKLSNNEINNYTDIKIESDDSNDDLLDKQRDVGKLKGSYRFVFNVYDGVNGELLDNASEVKDICNPSENIIVDLPVSEETYSIGSVSASWKIDECVAEYNILAKKKIQGGASSIEDIIESGETVIDHTLEITDAIRQSGSVNIILDDFIESNFWQNNDEIVLLITALNPQSVGTTEILADPIKFYIGTPKINPSGNLTLVDKAQAFYDKLINGEITFDMIKSITDENGNAISFADFKALITELGNHPDQVISIYFNEN